MIISKRGPALSEVWPDQGVDIQEIQEVNQKVQDLLQVHRRLLAVEKPPQCSEWGKIIEVWKGRSARTPERGRVTARSVGGALPYTVVSNSTGALTPERGHGTARGAGGALPYTVVSNSTGALTPERGRVTARSVGGALPYTVVSNSTGALTPERGRVTARGAGRTLKSFKDTQVLQDRGWRSINKHGTEDWTTEVNFGCVTLKPRRAGWSGRGGGPPLAHVFGLALLVGPWLGLPSSPGSGSAWSFSSRPLVVPLVVRPLVTCPGVWQSMLACPVRDFVVRGTSANHIAGGGTCRNTGRPYYCCVCGRTFRQSGALRAHHRTHTAEKPYQCSECGKSFNQQSTLHTHHRTHTGERPFHCAECGKSFRQQSNLRIHQRVHTGERPYRCPECGKRNIRGHVERHQRVHTGERPYQCPECRRSFKHSGTLKTHKGTKTEDHDSITVVLEPDTT
ncbi:hypothetical protein NFI96_031825 [Prochilodus magdalenae]|nr:hypothetical protein NFI96_031825 [Prochilodus magdalenae]